MAKAKPTPIICPACHLDHLVARPESCAAFQAELRISKLYHNGGTAAEIREAQADRAEATGQHEKAAMFRREADALRGAA